MVDDDDVALHRFAAHFRDVATLKLAALLTNAGLGARVEFVPQQAGLRQFRQLGPVARAGRFFPGGDGAILLDLLQAVQHRLIRQVVKLFAAQIIVAPLHVADREAGTRRIPVQRLLEKRDVLVEELFLQILCSSRDDDALARANHRHQIRQRLPRARACFHNEVPLFFQRLLDRLRHLQLAATEFVRWMRAREHSAGGEELVERGILTAGNGAVGGRSRRGLGT